MAKVEPFDGTELCQFCNREATHTVSGIRNTGNPFTQNVCERHANGDFTDWQRAQENRRFHSLVVYGRYTN